jgi:hypothetical protein
MRWAKKVFLKKGFALATLGGAGVGLVLMFQNCAQPGELKTRIEIAPQVIYESPFDREKIHLDQSTFSASLTADSLSGDSIDHVDKKVGPDKTVSPDKTGSADTTESVRSKSIQAKSPVAVILIDNACARIECPSGVVNSDLAADESISCPLVRKQLIPSLSSATQYYQIELPPLASREEALDWIQSSPVDRRCVLGLAEERTYRLSATPVSVAPDSIPLSGNIYDKQRPYLDAIGLQAALTAFKNKLVTFSPVKVAVVDTGVGEVPDLEGAVINRTDMRGERSKSAPGCAPFSNIAPNNNHGTFVAGIIAARNRNANGFVGVAPNAMISAFAVGDCNGRMTTSEVANAIQQAVLVDQAEIVNLSLGLRGLDDVGLRSAIALGINRNVLFIAAAGNDGQSLDDKPVYPAAYTRDYQGLLSVGSADSSSHLSSFSNFSESLVDLAAPGEEMISCYNDGENSDAIVIEETDEAGKSVRFTRGSGTSYAAPLVTGAAALAIGYLKAKGLPFNSAHIEGILADSAVVPRVHLTGKVRNASFLSLTALEAALARLGDSTLPDLPLSLTPMVWSGTGASQTIRTTASWNLPVLDLETRLGVFDLSSGCNYSRPCLLQEFPVSSRSGSQGITLSRNEIAPLMGSITDPTFALYIGVAVYRKKPDGSFRTMASSHLNLRDIDRSTQASQLLGRLEAVRSDMKHIYYKGWSCLQDSNRTVKVQLQTPTGSSIATSYSYSYPLMVPHGDTLDHWDWGGEGTVIADRITEVFTNQQSHQAGHEGHPIVIDSCRTLTAAHAFELMIPVALAKSLGSGQLIKVKASITDATGAMREIFLRDEFGSDVFPLPAVNSVFQSGTTVTVERGSAAHRFQGQICSNSPSPIEMEISYTRRNFLKALVEGTQAKISPFPGRTGLAHNPKTEGRVVNGYIPSFTNGYVRPENFFEFQLVDWGDLDQLGGFAGFFDSLNPTPPNAAIPCLDNSPLFENKVNSMGLLEPGTQSRLKIYCRKQIDAQYGETMRSRVSDHYSYRDIGATPQGASIWWDYYDVGEPFSINQVGYQIRLHSTVGKYLSDTYNVRSLLREIKKFETPLGHQTMVLDHAILQSDGTRCGSGFRHNLSYSMDFIPSLHPKLEQRAQGYWYESESAPNIFLLNTLEQTMRRLPYTLRFFQDGRMILHLQASTGTTAAPVVGYDFNLRDP